MTSCRIGCLELPKSSSRRLSRLVARRLNAPLKSSERVYGRIYAFTRADKPGLLKVGFTSKPVEVRLRQWHLQCGQRPILLYKSSLVPHAARIEQLIKYELSPNRHIASCSCGKVHREWFKATCAGVQRSTRMWAEWLIKKDRYDEDGNAIYKVACTTSWTSSFWRSQCFLFVERDYRYNPTNDIILSELKDSLCAGIQSVESRHRNEVPDDCQIVMTCCY